MAQKTHHEDTPTKGPAWRAAEEYGFDMSVVEWNLRLTPLERIRENDRANALDESLAKAMEARCGRL